MSKFATKAAANMFCQARYEAAKSNERLSSREGAAEEIGIDRTRLARIELGSTIPYQEEVLLMQSKGEYVPEKTDKIVECATMLGYMSPFLCVSTWISGIENTQIYKWGIIILVHILGIGIPLLVKKKK